MSNLLGKKIAILGCGAMGSQSGPGDPLQFILALGVKQLMGAGIIRLRHEHFGEPVQIAVVGQGGVHKLLRGDDAVLFEHRHEHLGVDDRAGVEKFHAENLATDGHR